MNVDGFKVNDLVWGKMKGFPPWPGLVVSPSEDVVGKRFSPTAHCIYFFGSRNYSWLEEKFIKPYAEYKKAYSAVGKQASFLEAVTAAEEYAASGLEGLPPSPDTAPEKSASKKRKQRDSPPDNCREESYKPKTARLSLIDRPPRSEPRVALTDVKSVSRTLKEKGITPTSVTVGFLGLGIMGSRVARNVLQSGHRLMVWNRTPSKCEQFEEGGAEVGLTPADVVQRSDLTFSCVSDPQAAKELVFGNCGVLSEMKRGKGFVELTGIDADTSQDIAESVRAKGGRYLEAMMCGSLTEAEDGSLVFLCAGDRDLFLDCQSVLRACSERTPYFLGPTGSAANMQLVLQAVRGVAVAALAEALSLLERLALPPDLFMEVLRRSPVYSPFLADKCGVILGHEFPTSQPLIHHQKDLRLALQLGQRVGHPMLLTAATNELYKQARRLGFGLHDTSSVYVRYKY